MSRFTNYMDMEILITVVQANENSQNPLPIAKGWGNGVSRLKQAGLVMTNGGYFQPTDKGRKRLHALASQLYE